MQLLNWLPVPLSEQEAEDDGAGGGAEDEGPAADHQGHGEAGRDGSGSTQTLP